MLSHSSSYGVWLTIFLVYVVFTMLPLPTVVIAIANLLLFVAHTAISYATNPMKQSTNQQVGIYSSFKHIRLRYIQ